MLGVGTSISNAYESVYDVIKIYDFSTFLGKNSTALEAKGFVKADSGNFTILDDGTTDTDLGATKQASNGWVAGYGNTGSADTGPGGGCNITWGGSNSHPVTKGTQFGSIYNTSGNGVWDTEQTSGYMFYEASNPATVNGAASRIGAIRTLEYDFSRYSKVTLQMWIHAFGSAFNGADGSGLAIATSNSATDCSNSGNTGNGLVDASSGGENITIYTELDTDATQSLRVTHTTLRATGNNSGTEGQLQSTGHTTSLAATNRWRFCEVDLAGASGNSGMYIYFVYFTHVDGAAFKQDLALSNLRIIGHR